MAQYDPKKLRCEFDCTYEAGRSPVVRELECCVLGRDYGGTSWTTRDEADRMAEHLALRPGMQLLDIGSGAGWPGLYLAQTTGCEVTLADVPLAGLRVAAERAAADALVDRTRVVAADGAHLPFADESFDALSHADVLCCMPAKMEMLCECRRVARAEAVMEFSVIILADGMSEADREIAIEGAPRFVEAPDDYGALLRQSGWQVMKRIDVTADLARLVRIFVAGTIDRSEALLQAYGAEEFAERMSRRRAALAATERGLLKREIYLVTTSF